MRRREGCLRGRSVSRRRGEGPRFSRFLARLADVRSTVHGARGELRWPPAVKLSPTDDSLGGLLVHQDFVRRVAHELARDPAEAEDLAQEAWLRALRRPPGPVQSARGWLRKLVFHVSCNRWRRSRARAEAEASLEPAPAVPTPDEIVAREQQRSLVRDALDALPAHFREVLALRFLDGLATETIARRLGVSIETVRSRRRRGLALLRARLGVFRGEGAAPERRRARALPALALLRWARRARERAPRWSPWRFGALVVPAVAATVLVLRALGPAASARAVDAAPLAAAPVARASDLLQPVAAMEPARREAPPADETLLPAAERARAVRVQLLDAAGSAAAGVPVLLEAWPPPGGPGEREPRIVRARSDALGRVLERVAWPGPWRVTPLVGDAAWVTAGEDDATLLRLPAPLRVAGSVRGPAGEPLAGARVLASWPGRRTPWEELARTDADGSFAIACDRDGWIAFEHERLGLSELFHAAAGADGVGALDVRLRETHPGARGRVLDAAGAPVAGARVFWAADEEAALAVNGFERLRGSATPLLTDAGGAFTLPRVGVRALRLDVLAPGFRPRTVRVAAAALADVVLIDEADVLGRVRDAAGEPAGGVTLELCDEEQNALWRATSADDGTFDLGEVTPRPLVVVARDPRGRGGAVARVEPTNGTAFVELRLGQERSIAGCVVGADARPCAGRDVVLAPAAPPALSAPAGAARGAERAVTDAAGRFRFDGLAGERYDLCVVEGPEATRTAWASGVAPGGAPVTLGPLAAAGASVRARVVGLPEDARAKLFCRDSGEVRTLASAAPPPDPGADEAGRPLHAEGLVAGRYELGFASPTRGSALLRAFELRPGEALALGTLHAERALGTLAGRVFAPAGALEGLELRVTLPGHQLRADTRGGAFEVLPDGSFRCSGLRPGSASLRATLPGRAALREDFDLRPGEETLLELRFE